MGAEQLGGDDDDGNIGGNRHCHNHWYDRFLYPQRVNAGSLCG